MRNGFKADLNDLMSSLESSASLQFDMMEPSDRPIGFEHVPLELFDCEPLSPFAALHVLHSICCTRLVELP